MRTVLTLAAAAVINLAALAAMEWNVTRAQLPPAGEVIVTQVEEATYEAPLAQVKVEGQLVRTASNGR